MISGHSRELWQQAEENMEAARLCHLNGFYRAAISRYYYAVKCAAQAVLWHARQVRIKTHRQLRRKFGEELVKTGQVCAKWGKELSKLYELRRVADYSLSTNVDEATADDVFARSKEFLNGMRPLLSAIQPD